MWRNAALLTFLPMDEVRRLGALKAEINKAKEILAFEITKMIHTEEDVNAQEAARALFGGGADSENIPTRD